MQLFKDVWLGSKTALIAIVLRATSSATVSYAKKYFNIWNQQGFSENKENYNTTGEKAHFSFSFKFSFSKLLVIIIYIFQTILNFIPNRLART